MRGEILHYDDRDGVGQISGADGGRYGFRRADLKQLVQIGPGTVVDFVAEGNEARDIYIVSQPQRVGVPNAGGYHPSYGATGQGGYTAPNADPGPYNGPIEPQLGLWGYFTRAITSYYFNFSGRARRAEYWSFQLFYVIVLLVLGIITAAGGGMALGSGNTPGALFWVGAVAIVVFFLATILPAYSLLARRFHDFGQSGWWVLGVLAVSLFSGAIPALGILPLIIFIVVGCINSQPHANQYGPPPKRV